MSPCQHVAAIETAFVAVILFLGLTTFPLNAEHGGRNMSKRKLIPPSVRVRDLQLESHTKSLFLQSSP